MNRDQLLREMGLAPIWRLREHRPVAEAGAAAPVLSPGEPATPPPGSEPASVPARLPMQAEPVPATFAASEPAPAEDVPIRTPGDGGALIGPERVGRIAAMSWEELAATTIDCRACGLCAKRRQAVFGVGDERPDWLFVGEAPGEQEDERGEPFVGPAGALLDSMLAALGLVRGQGVYIANAVKCRPPSNRTPSAEEIAACRPFLARQVALLRPRLIVLLGRAAVQAVLDSDAAISSLRGKVHAFAGVPVVVTYHPAYLLRTLPEKAKAWEDLCLARRALKSAPERRDGPA